MRVAIYNQMFGLDGRSFFKNLIGHYYVHFQKNSEKAFKKMDLDKTFEIIKNAKADILGICEIYEGTEKEIIKGLKKLGYEYFYFGKGHRFKYNDKHVIELIASKIKGKSLNYEMWPVENRLGGGGGFCVVKFRDFSIFHVHLALPKRGFFEKQIKYMQKIIKELDGNVLVMGDFNYSYKKLKKYFPNLKLVTQSIKTCSLTPILKWFFWKDCDHIFARGFDSKNIGILEGRSDHKLIYSDLE